MIAAAEHPQTRNQVFDVGGPEVLTWDEVAAVYSEVLGRPVKVSTLPPVCSAACSKCCGRSRQQPAT